MNKDSRRSAALKTAAMIGAGVVSKAATPAVDRWANQKLDDAYRKRGMKRRYH